MDEFTYEISAEKADERIDKFLSGELSELSRSYIQKLLKEGMVTLNGRPLKANYRLREKDEIEIRIPPAMEPDILPENIPLDILYEDRDVLVVNKPKGMVVHPGAGHYSGTLVNALLYHCGDSLSGINGVLRPGIVHRIDRDTTGSLLVCKNDIAHRSIAEQLKVHSFVETASTSPTARQIPASTAGRSSIATLSLSYWGSLKKPLRTSSTIGAPERWK